MTPRDQAPGGLRRAALSLHGLHPEDRDWVLSALPADQSKSLEALLGELRELGIPREGMPLEPSIQASGAPSGVDLVTLDACELERLAELLSREPPRMAAVLLAAYPWKWRERLMARMHSPPQMREAHRPGPSAPALHAAVVRVLQRELSSIPCAGKGIPRGYWSWLRALVRRRSLR